MNIFEKYGLFSNVSFDELEKRNVIIKPKPAKISIPHEIDAESLKSPRFDNPNRNNFIVDKILNRRRIKKLNLKITDKKKYYNKSFQLGIPQIDLNKLKDKIFGIENNLDELNGIDFKKGCYIGQENTSRIKLRNKLRRRILPVQKISGDVSENDVIKYKDNEVGKIMIDKPYSFALIKVVEPDLKEFTNIELTCGHSKVKILKPDWI